MAKQFRVRRKIGTIAVVAGGFATLDLPRDYDYEAIGLRINGGLQVTALATSVRAENPCQVVSRIEVIADGKNNLHSAPFWFDCLAKYDRPIIESGARAVTPASGVAVATYQVEANGIVDFMTVDGLRPKDSNFRPAGLSLFQLRLTFGNPGDAFVGGTVVFSAMNVDVYAMQLVEMPEADGSFTKPYMLKKVSYQEIALPASNANQELRLPAGNLMRSVVLRTAGAVTADEPAATILNNAQLVNGIDVRYNLAGANIRAINNLDYGQLTAGYYVLDLLARGSSAVNLTELWDVSNPSDPKAILDITGGANVKAQAVITEYIAAGA